MINRPGPGKVCGKGHRVASLSPPRPESAHRSYKKQSIERGSLPQFCFEGLRVNIFQVQGTYPNIFILLPEHG